MKTILAAFLALVLGGCLGVSDSSWFFRGEVENLGEVDAQAVIRPIAIKVLANGVVGISGTVTTQCWVDGVTLDGDRRGKTLVLNIGRVGQEPCQDTRARLHDYAGIFSGLRPGSHNFRVVNQMGAQPVVEFETTLELDY
jgi:hypothetical protein